MSCWRSTPTPKQDRFQDLLEAIWPDFLHTTLTKLKNYHCYSNIPQLLSAEVVLCVHKTTILCQFGLFCHQLTTVSPSILNHFWWELYQYTQNGFVTKEFVMIDEDSQTQDYTIVYIRFQDQTPPFSTHN